MAYADTATDRQTDFVNTLFNEAMALVQDGSDAVKAEWEVQVPKVVPVRPVLVKIQANQEVTKGEASDAITVLKNLTAALRRADQKASVPVALRDYFRVIPNRFAKRCVRCNEKVEAGEGYAAQSSKGGWETWCKSCAAETDEARAQRLAAAQVAERAEALAAQAAAREASLARQDVAALLIDTFRRANVIDKVRPELRVALPSATGNNDLDFFLVRSPLTVFRVIGGHPDQPLDSHQAVAVAERLCLTDDLKAASVLFGQELGFCGRCGRHLTDEASRAQGLGPDCAERF